MEFDVIEIISKVGFPITVCLILSYILWKMIPVINGLKDIIKDLVTVVQVDSTNTANMKDSVDMNTTQVSRLCTEIAKINGKK